MRFRYDTVHCIHECFFEWALDWMEMSEENEGVENVDAGEEGIYYSSAAAGNGGDVDDGFHHYLVF